MESSPEIVNFGRSLIVPSVQELAKENITKIPPRYVRDEEDPTVSILSGDHLPIESVPIVDLHTLLFGSSVDSEFERGKLHSACQKWGFFQVINHGLSASLLEDLKRDITDFFELPLEEKKKLWQTPENHEGFGQLFVVSEEQKLDWSNMFYITTLPNSLRIAQLFESLPTQQGDTGSLHH